MTDWGVFTIISSLAIWCMAGAYRWRTGKQFSLLASYLMISATVALTGMGTLFWRSIH